MPDQSNFGFIAKEWPEIYASCLRAEEYMASDPRSACFYARHAIEQLVEHIYLIRRLRTPYRDDLSAKIHDAQFKDLSTHGVTQKLDLIRKVGNHAVHAGQPTRQDVSLRVLQELHHVLIWAAQRFSARPNQVPVDSTFDPRLAARRQPMRVDDLRKLAVKVQREQEEFRRQIEESEARAQSLEEELEQLRAQVAAGQAEKQIVDTHDYDEAQTNLDLVDVDLREAGWSTEAPGDANPLDLAEREVRLRHPGTGALLYADYVLFDDDGLPLAVVESKRTSRNADVGQEQAREYADALEAQYGQRPLIFCTNGYRITLWDDHASMGTTEDTGTSRGYPPRTVEGFLTKEELQWRIQSRNRRKALAEVPVKDALAGRDYQARAIRSINEAFTEHRRAGLLVMATGTGKTRTVIALADQMMRAAWAKRVLFLADRVALVRQAANAFKTHLPEEPPVNLVEEPEQQGRIFVSTYPTMLNRINAYSEKGEGPFSPGYFDLIIVDEAHRSVYQKYKRIFEWFDALLLGLTATPVDQVDKNTYLLFGQEPGVPTDAYTLEEATDEGYLVPARTLTLGTRFLQSGINYEDLPEEEKEEWDALEWDEDGAIPDTVTSAEMNQRLFNVDTVDKVLNELMDRGITVDGGDRLGKTIIFAKNQAHAVFIKERFDAQYPMYGGTFARIITHQEERAQSLIETFSMPESELQIAITVDMLDTGIDVPEIVNLLFFKQVFSKTKFWQMVGRGTRTRKDLFGPGQDKEEFLILDFAGNVEFFNANVPEREIARPQTLTERLFRRRLELLTTLRGGSPTEQNDTGGPVDLGWATVDGVEYGTQNFESDLVRSARRHVLGLNPQNVQVRPHRQLVETYSEAEPWEQLSAVAAQELAEALGQLPSSVQQEKEEAKTFDLTILRAQLAQLTGDGSGWRAQRSRIQEIASNLLTKTNVPAVAEQARLLQDLITEHWWENATALMLENVRRKLRHLVVYVDKRTWKPVHTSFTDELGEVREIELSPVTPGTNMRRFREKANRFLNQHMENLTVQKIRHNRELTPEDLHALENLLLEADVGTREDLTTAAEEAQGLGLFIRSLVGLDRVAVQESFEDFIAGSTFSSDQLQFIRQVINYLTANGTMTAGALYEPPLSDNGDPEDLLGDENLDGVISIIDEIRRRASPALTERSAAATHYSGTADATSNHAAAG